MGKSRSRYGSAERLLHPASHHVAVAAADHLADLDEEDVWSVLAAPPAAAESNRINRQDHRIGRWAAGAGGLSHGGSTAAARQQQHHQVASSAPVKVPEWGGEQQYAWGEAMEGEWVAPHEYVQGRGTSTAASVFEGVGRTLKGRDLSRVRDAVWSNTGFFG